MVFTAQNFISLIKEQINKPSTHFTFEDIAIYKEKKGEKKLIGLKKDEFGYTIIPKNYYTLINYLNDKKSKEEKAQITINKLKEEIIEKNTILNKYNIEIETIETEIERLKKNSIETSKKEINKLEIDLNQILPKKNKLINLLKENKKELEELEKINSWKEAKEELFYKLSEKKYNYEKEYTPKNKMMLCHDSVLAFCVYILNWIPNVAQLIFIETYEKLEELKQLRRIVLNYSRGQGKTTGCLFIQMYETILNIKPVDTLKGTSWMNYHINKDKATELYLQKIFSFFYTVDKQVEIEFDGVYGEKFFSDKIPERKIKSISHTRQNLGILSENYKLKTPKINCNISSNSYVESDRGDRTCINVDEFAWVDTMKGKRIADGFDFLEKTLLPLTKGQDGFLGTCLVSSTPNGKNGGFYKLINPEQDFSLLNFILITIPFYKDNNIKNTDIILEEIESLIVSDNSIESKLQEYMCHFLDSENQFFKEQPHIENLFDNSLQKKLTSEKKCIIFIDWAVKRKGCLLIVEKTSEKQNTLLNHFSYGENESRQMFLEVEYYLKNYNVEKLCYDSRGGGAYTTQELHEICDSYNVNYEEFNFGISGIGTNKQKVYATLKQSLENNYIKKKIKAYPDMLLLKEIRSLSKDLKPLTASGSDDFIISLATAHYLIQEEDENFEFVNLKEFKTKIFKKKTNSIEL